MFNSVFLSSKMVRQKSGEMSSPTPSVENLNGALPLCDLDRQVNISLTCSISSCQFVHKLSPREQKLRTVRFLQGDRTFSISGDAAVHCEFAATSLKERFFCKTIYSFHKRDTRQYRKQIITYF